jgi:hypothetical protein
VAAPVLLEPEVALHDAEVGVDSVVPVPAEVGGLVGDSRHRRPRRCSHAIVMDFGRLRISAIE